MSQISLTFPDGAKRAVQAGTTGLDVAKSIAPSLAKRSVAMSLNGKLADLAAPIKADAAIKFLTREDKEALELIRHDAAHVMAQAVQELYPGTQVTIGPVIDNGFYYDFAREEPFTPEDLPKIEAKMREIIARDAPFSCEVVDRKAAKKLFADKGETFKLELIDAIPEGDEIKLYSQREWLDLCRGPHMTSTGKVGKGFKLLKIAGAYWRGDSNNPCSSASTARRGPARRTSRPICISSKRRRSATIAAWAARWICSISRRRRRAPCSGIPRAGPCSPR